MPTENLEVTKDLLNQIVEMNMMYEELAETNAYNKITEMNELNKRNLVFQLLVDWFNKEELIEAIDEWVTALEIGMYERFIEIEKEYENKKE